jgi:Ca2+-binding RTX toxin-like protein
VFSPAFAEQNNARPSQTFHAEGGEPVMLPSGRFATDAQYLRHGDDLHLVGHDGATVVVEDYFLSAAPPTLLTPEGGKVTPDLVRSFTISEAAGQVAQVGTVQEQPIGQATSVVGQVSVVRASGVREQIGAGDPVYQGDVVETGDSGSVNLLFVDKTTFALGGDARLALDELVFNPDTHEGSSTFSVLKGVFVFSSGAIAKLDPTHMTVKTTVATIGIRGTKVAGEINPAGEISKFTILHGKITVTTDAGQVLLDDANETTFVSSFSDMPTSPIVLSSEEVDTNYSQVKDISGGYYGVTTASNGSEGGDQQGGGSYGGSGGEEPNLDDLAGELSDLAPAAGGNSEPQEELAPIIVQNKIDLNRGSETKGFQPDSGSTGDSEDDGNGAVPAGSDDAPSQPGLSDGGDPGNPFDFGSSSQPVNSVGTDGADTMIGGSANDVLDGGDGGDVITGNAGDDTLTGGSGDDFVSGGPGDDTLIGGTGQGNDSYDGGDGFDRLILSSANDSVTVDLANGTSSGPDIDSDVFTNIEAVTGGAGNDLFIAGVGNFSLDGGNGIDTIDFSAAQSGMSVDLEAGTAESSDFGSYTLTNFESVLTGAGNDTLAGSAGNDTLNGGGGDDLLFGRDGDDVYRIAVGSGSDTIHDTGGTDRLVLTGLSDGLPEFGGTSRIGDDLLIALGGETIRIQNHFGGDTIETVTFEIEGGQSETYVLATGVVGGNASGVLTGTDGADTLNPGGGDDFVFAGGGNDLLIGGPGDDSYDGGDGIDTLDYSFATSAMAVDMAAGTADGGPEAGSNVFSDIEAFASGAGDDSIQGSGGNDAIFANGGADVVSGGEGSDLLSGGDGDDTLSGDAGDDTLSGDAGDDVLDGGAGNDTVLGGAGHDGAIFTVGESDGADF